MHFYKVIIFKTKNNSGIILYSHKSLMPNLIEAMWIFISSMFYGNMLFWFKNMKKICPHRAM